MTHLAFELRTNTPGSLLPALAEPRLLGPWRDTVDEVVLVPVRADEAGPARDLVDAAVADF